MFTIGEFAGLGRVSIRMLRHYDRIGVLRPAAVDPVNGYRLYRADQLSRLNRVVALSSLGFTLAQVRSILEGPIDVAELRGMLRLRQAELHTQLEADRARLTGVEARLRIIAQEGTMSTQDVVVKRVEPVRLAEMTATAASFATRDIGPVIQTLYPQLMRELDRAGIRPTGYGIAYYEAADDDSVVIHAGIMVDADPVADQAFRIGDLAGEQSAATIIHRGSMDTCEESYQALAQWTEANGYRAKGFAREVYVDYDPERPDDGVTELQMPIEKT
ncbi:DNA-binding transcriptional regulator, MerR family [Nakamurella panacisegetis]|uniref:DNA-binding transcriptional regulator, MerR family n=1 Tax=Nakamurella panacisegetis TaxID=1090615 RepID=A0A1H0L4S3_9ACTN|nr:MerR family transcriptional regulator [Nakamurella panacisegetis]SDO63062.1 DNA-binding transcriptional regulator, MerR family [Nakamurella panacisegetis]